MQYCKNCGRQLADDIRFCDRCGQSVRQSKNSGSEKKQRQIEKLQRERLERQKRRAEREIFENKKKERKLEKRKKHSKLFIFAFVCIVMMIVIAIISYIITTMTSKDEEWKTNQPIGGLTTDLTPTMQPSQTLEPAADEPKQTSVKYEKFSLSNGMTLSYPDEFSEEDTENSAEKLRLSNDDSALITVTSVEYPGGTISSLMDKYAEDFGGRTTYSLTGNDWYTITIEDNDVIHHRKYVIDRDNDRSIYYDFEYNASSDRAEDYESFTDHMDKSFSLPDDSDSDSESD